jgi:hypothetical protein
MRYTSTLIGLLATVASSIIVSAQSFPSIIHLPDGWATEGIATGRGTTFYAGCRDGTHKGAIYRGDLRTGQGRILVSPDANRVTLGLKVDPRSNYIFAAGAATGQASVFDGTTGSLKATFHFFDPTTGPTFVNDVVITRTAAFFTDSKNPVLYRVPLGAGGELASGFDVLPMNGFVMSEPISANGIAATPDGSSLIVVNMFAGILYRVDPVTGDATPIDLGGSSVSFGDGILLSGHTLYVVRNFMNLLTTIELDPSLEFGTVVSEVTSPYFDIPATVAEFGNSLYLINARFTTQVTAATTYSIVKISK